MITRTILRSIFFGCILGLHFSSGLSSEPGKPLIFPIPLEITYSVGNFKIDESVILLASEKPDETGDFLSLLFLNEMTDKYSMAIKKSVRSSIPEKERFVLMGDLTNPLVKRYCEKSGIVQALKALGNEGYILSVTDNSIVVAANTKNGALFGFESLRQTVKRDSDGLLCVPRITVKDSPQFAFRGIKLYLPGKENIIFFKRFIKDFAALYKFNKIILELNANMRLERHPELNTGAVAFFRHLNFSRLDRPPGRHMEFQNSSHQDNADGEILEKEEVADLVRYMRNFNIEVIPELPSLTHSYYLLAGHENLAENRDQPFPDTYCPLKPEIYKIYFDVLDEYIEVIHPSIIHIGHDEWRVEKDICPLCRGKDYGQLYADDVRKIHDYLSKKGIRTALWGDHLLESVTHKDHQEWKSSSGYRYNIPGALTPDQVVKMIPKDIIVFNWFWSNSNNDKQISGFGFEQVYGNFTPEITGWDERVRTKGLLGGAPSSWAGTTLGNFGKDMIFEFLGTANLLWSKHFVNNDDLTIFCQDLADETRKNLSGKINPGDLGINIKTLDITSYFNSALNDGRDSLNSMDLLTGSVKADKKIFNLDINRENNKRAIVVSNKESGTNTQSVNGIKVDKDLNSIIFLHACAKPGRNRKAYNMIYNFDETAELLGWYSIKYDDGYLETIPIRYGVNILEWNCRERTPNQGRGSGRDTNQRSAYNATTVNCSKIAGRPIIFFSYEWENKRYGKKITEISLNSVRFSGSNENALILLAISLSDNTIKLTDGVHENE